MTGHVVGQWSAADTQISTSMGDDTVILNIHSGRYFTLSGVGTALWQALQTPNSADDLVRLLLERYTIDENTARHDVYRLLSDLEAAGLVRPH